VVIAIIAILASMLLPALTKAKHSAFRAVCLSNMHQQHLTQAHYASDNDGCWPLRNENSADYQRQHGYAGSIVSLMRGTYVLDTRIMICPLVAGVPGQPYDEYRCNTWLAGNYGGWDTHAAHVYTAYMWLGGYRGGGNAIEMFNDEPPPPLTERDATAEHPFITHRVNYFNLGGDRFHDIGHLGLGLLQWGPYPPYEVHRTTEQPVGYADGHATVHQRGEIQLRMSVGGSFPGYYLW
jgi:hypothetical protein